MDLKNYEKNPYRMDFGYISNNSVFASLGMDYTDAAQRARTNGEPGFAWLGNMQSFSLMNGEPDWKDIKATGGNPCLTGDTWILTNEGPKQIFELIGKQFTAIVDGKEYKRTNQGFWKSGDRMVNKIVLEKGKSEKS